MARSIGLNDDLNNYGFAHLGLFYCDGVDSVSHKPQESLFNYIILNIRQGASARLVQFFFCINDRTLYYRSLGGTTWSAWRQMNYTEM